MELTLQAEIRTEKGTGAAHKLRREGLVPAVVYAKAEAENLKLPRRDLERLVAHAGTGRLVSLAVKRGKKAEKTPVLIKEVQRHPLRGEIIHVDFHAVALDEAISTHVPVRVTGEEKRVHDGAVIEIYLREVEVSCLPTLIPEVFNVDASRMVMGDSVHVRDLAVPDGVKILTPPEELLVAAAAPAAVKEETPAEATEAEAVPVENKEAE